jgi:hypothetical protein
MTASVAAITEDVWTDLATGYEPMFTDRPAQLRHPLLPATRIVSNTADGSIVSNVVDMSAYARFLLVHGERADGRGGRILSDEGFERLMASAVDDGEHGRYGYGVWEEEVDGHTWFGHTGGMVGYTATTIVVEDEGLGCVLLQNGGGGRQLVVAAALAAVRAGLSGDPLPSPWAPPAATTIPAADRFVGAYAGDDGRSLEVSEEDDGLAITIGSVVARLERDPLLREPGTTFLVAHPALERFALEFQRDPEGRVAGAFHGGTWFGRDEDDGPLVDALPEAWRRHPGLYRNDDPWYTVLRIVERRGRLAILWPADATGEDGGELVPLEDGSFAIGDAALPRRVRFEGDIRGMTAVTVVNGGRWFRSFEP